MGYSTNPSGSDFTIVNVVLQYGVFATSCFVYGWKGCPCDRLKEMLSFASNKDYTDFAFCIYFLILIDFS